jgi:hypothetical protein
MRSSYALQKICRRKLFHKFQNCNSDVLAAEVKSNVLVGVGFCIIILPSNLDILVLCRNITGTAAALSRPIHQVG